MAKRLRNDGGKAPRTRVAEWTPRRANQFLDYLVSTGNVRLATQRSGATEHQVLARKRSDPDFAAAWQAVIEIWYGRLEEMLIERAMLGDAAVALEGKPPEAATLPEDKAPPEAAAPVEEDGAPVAAAETDAIRSALDVDLAKWMLEMRRGPKAARRGAAPSARPTAAETDAALAKQLAAKRKRLEAGE